MTVDIAAITQIYRCNFVSNRLISFFERKKRKFIITKTGFFIVCIRLTMSVLCQRHSAAVEGSTLSGFIAAIFIIDDAFLYTHTCTVDWKKKEKEFIYWKKKIAAVASFTQSSSTNHSAYIDLNTFELNLTVLWAGKNCNSVTLANSGYLFFFFLRFQHSKHFFNVVYFGIFAGSHYFIEMSKECRVFVCVSSSICIIHSVLYKYSLRNEERSTPSQWFYCQNKSLSIQKRETGETKKNTIILN